MDSLLYYIWLSLRTGAGNEKASFLLSKFSSPKNIYDATREELYDSLGDYALVNLLCDKDLSSSERILEYCERANVGILTPESNVYPQRLRAIYAKPVVLYYKGRFPDVDKNVLLALVGTRKCSDKGARMAYKLGAELSSAGAIVVSGLASGVDSMCARGALSVGAHTIAVLGCGIDRVYPSENEKLMRTIEERGTVITEYAPGMPPNGKHFPVRNRIISGLSLGTVVVEAGKFSGALITAEHARNQGRDVFALPGDVENENYSGNNLLIKEGAKIARDAKDILSEYESVWNNKIFTEKINQNKYYTGDRIEYIEKNPTENKESKIKTGFFKKRFSKNSESENKNRKTESAASEKDTKTEGKVCADIKEEILTSLSGIEKLVYENLSGAFSCDEIAAEILRKSGENIGVGEIFGALTTLEIDGYCKELPGGIFVRT